MIDAGVRRAEAATAGKAGRSVVPPVQRGGRGWAGTVVPRSGRRSAVTDGAGRDAAFAGDATMLYHEREAQEGRNRLRGSRAPRLQPVPAPPGGDAGAREPGERSLARPGRDMLPDLLASVRAFAIPMRTRFRGITVREGALLRGTGGLGRVLPVRRVRRRASAPAGWPARSRRRRPAGRPRSGTGCRSTRRSRRSARAGARHRRRLGLPDRQGQGGRARRARVGGHGHGSRRSGTRSGPAGKLRVDANGGWDVDAGRADAARAGRVRPGVRRAAVRDARRAGRAAPAGGRAAGRRRVDPPGRGPAAVRAAGAADIVVLKAQPLGGVAAALEIAAACGLPVVVSSAVESSVGLAAGVALAAALPGAGLRLRAGHDGAADRRRDRRARCCPRAAKLPVRAARADPAQLARWEVDPAPWRARMLRRGGVPRARQFPGAR